MASVPRKWSSGRGAFGAGNLDRSVALVVAAVLVLWVSSFATRGFFSGDSGMKLAQADGLWRSHYTSRAIPYDYELDPQGRFHPYGDLVRKVGDTRQGIYSVVFTGLSAPFIAGLGVHGLPVLPLLGGLLVAFGVFRVGRNLGAHVATTSAAVAVATLLTPIAFYSSQYAEHTLAAGLAIVAFVPLSRAPGERARLAPLFAGMLAAAAALVRPEGYCVVASLGLVVFARPDVGWRARLADSLWYLLGCVPLLLAYWGVNHLTADAWDPVVSRNTDRSSSWANATVMAVGEIKRARALTWLAPFAGAVLVSLAPARPLRGVPRAALVAVAGVALGFVTWRAYDLAAGRTLVGLFAVTPVAAYGLLAGPWAPRTRGLWLFAVTFVAQVLAFDKSGTAGGLQFGARLLLPAVPVLVLLAATTAEASWRTFARRGLAALAIAPPVAMCALTAVVMFDGVRKPIEIAEGGWAATAAAIDAAPDVVVTRRWWESQVMAPVRLSGKQLYNIHGNPRPLLDRLADRGVERFVLVTRGPDELPLSNGRRARTVSRSSDWLEVRVMEIVTPQR